PSPPCSSSPASSPCSSSVPAPAPRLWTPTTRTAPTTTRRKPEARARGLHQPEAPARGLHQPEAPAREPHKPEAPARGARTKTPRPRNSLVENPTPTERNHDILSQANRGCGPALHPGPDGA